MDPLKPNPALLAKLGSAIVHIDEMLSPEGHQFDEIAMAAVLGDAEVREWLKEMNALAMLPVKRL